MDLVAPILRLVRGARAAPDVALELAPPVRLSRHLVRLENGHRVGVAVAGRGVPFVVVHGFGVESLLYAQPLARLAALGFRVVAVDVAGHGDTGRLGGLPDLDDYTILLARTIEHLGIRRAVLAGHSMGGRLVAEVAAERPDLAIGVLLLDALVGEAWERMRFVLRWVPPALAAYGLVFIFDTLGTVPVIADARQALKLSSRASRSINLHVVRPWRAVDPGQAILRAASASPVLDRLRDAGATVVVVHGDRDLLVPYAAGRDAARQTGGELVTVHGGGHSWLLRCPETLPGIVGDLLDGRLGAARDRVLRAAGCDPATATLEETEEACTSPDALERGLAHEQGAITLPARRHQPHFRWSFDAGEEAAS